MLESGCKDLPKAEVTDQETTLVVPLSFGMLLQRAAEGMEPGADPADHLLQAHRIDLSGLGITHIDNLDAVGPLTSLYLQRNRIRVLENLEGLTHLRFLSLASE